MKLVLTDASIEVDDNDLSEVASSVTIEDSTEDVDTTGFGARSREHSKGLRDATITVDFFQDFDAAAVDSILWPLYEGSEPFDVVVRPLASEPVGPENPEYTLSSHMFNYSPLAGSIGAASATQVTFRNADQVGLQRSDGS